MRYLFILIIFFWGSIKSFSQSTQVIFNHAKFQLENGEPYFETYLSFISSSLKYKANERGNLQAKLLVTQFVKQNNKIVDFKKYEVLGPELIDSIAIDFVDQKRFKLSKGTYNLELEIIDLNIENSKPVKLSETIDLDIDNSKVSISDIELIEYINESNNPNEFTKSGYDIVPYVSSYFPNEVEKLAYYFEIYAPKSIIGEKYLLKQSITNYETNKEVHPYVRNTRENFKSINSNIQLFDIRKLSTGNYILSVQLINTKNEIIAEKTVFFQRVNNVFIDPSAYLRNTIDISTTFVSNIKGDSLEKVLQALTPVASDLERNIIQNKMKNASEEMKQNFFYNFWTSRSELEPAKKWSEYHDLLVEANDMFGTKIREGYETDRGRIYVKYGKPNSVSNRPNEPSSYPYQIWHYYHLGKFNNIRFIFYAPDLVNDDYELLHSDLRGEVNNRRWQNILHKRNSPGNNIDDNNDGNRDHWGGESDDFYGLPR